MTRKAKNWTAKQLTALSRVTPDDVDDAVEWWKKNAPREVKTILDAKPQEQ